MDGRVESIYIAAEHGELPEPVDSVRAHAGRGLEGNRYYFDEAEPGTALTLIAAEALEAMEREHGISIEARESRRNVVTRGIDVNELVGKRFRVGGVECHGVMLCEPCTTLQAMTKPGVIKGLTHRGRRQRRAARTLSRGVHPGLSVQPLGAAPRRLGRRRAPALRPPGARIAHHSRPGLRPPRRHRARARVVAGRRRE